MTKKEFLKSLKWIKGQPPSNFVSEDGSYMSSGFSDSKGPIVCKTDSGKIFFVGDCNFLGGVCDCCGLYKRTNVTRYAYVYENERKRIK